MRETMKILLGRLMISLVLLNLAACQAAPVVGSENLTLIPEVTALVSPTPEDLPGKGEIEALQPVIDAILSGDVEARKELVRYTTTACTNIDGLGGPPKCEAGEDEGDIVQAFPLSGSEGTFARPETIDQSLLFQVSTLYAIYRTPPENYPADYWPAGEVALLFEREENGIAMPICVRVEDNRIVRLDYHIGQNAAQVLEGIPADHILWQRE